MGVFYFCDVKEVDYIIVGLGLAGISFCEELEKASKTYIVYDHQGPSASKTAAGLYNPVILKRYSLPWKAIEQFDRALPYFAALEKKLNISIMHSLPVCKVFFSPEDQNNWFSASDKPDLKRFISTQLLPNNNTYIQAPHALGEVLETGRIDLPLLINSYQSYLEERNAFAKAQFNHADIIFQQEHVLYENIKAKRIVFAEGYGITNNPYFNNLPLVGNKGEYIIIKAPDLKLTRALKTSFFVVPLGSDHYKVGATFNWTDKDSIPSPSAKAELIEKLKTLISCEYEIIEHIAGMRPTTGDRRALIGVHPKHKQLALLNGLGTRGIMASPLLAHYLFQHIENDTPLLPEIDINRFPKKF